MLNCEKDTPAMEKRVLRAAHRELRNGDGFRDCRRPDSLGIICGSVEIVDNLAEFDQYADELTLAWRKAQAVEDSWPFRKRQGPGPFSYTVKYGSPATCKNIISREGFYAPVPNKDGGHSYPATSQHITVTVTCAAVQMFPSLLCDGFLILDVFPEGEHHRVLYVYQGRGLKTHCAFGYVIGNRLLQTHNIEKAQRLYARTVAIRLEGKRQEQKDA